MLLIAGVTSSLAFGLPPYPAPIITAKVLSVIDGETIDVEVVAITGDPVVDVRDAQGNIINIYRISGWCPVDVGEQVQVRYIGIAAPDEASPFNELLVAGKTVYLELDFDHWDDEHRLLAYVYLDAEGYLMVNAILVGMGFANVVPDVYNDRYVNILQGLAEKAKELELGFGYSGLIFNGEQWLLLNASLNGPTEVIKAHWQGGCRC
jgi:endonuclease YncB( thermonuclease family)